MDVFFLAQAFYEGPVFLLGFPEDIHENHGLVFPEPGQHLDDEDVQADVLESDGIQHPATGLDDPGWRVPGPGQDGESFDHHGTEP